MADTVSFEWGKGIDDLIQFPERKKKAAEKYIPELIKNTVSEMHNVAFRRARFDTGFMRNNFFISISDGGYTGRLYGAAEYTIYHEYGTRFMTAQPAIRYAFMIHQKQFLDDVLKFWTSGK